MDGGGGEKRKRTLSLGPQKWRLKRKRNERIVKMNFGKDRAEKKEDSQKAPKVYFQRTVTFGEQYQ